MIQKFTLYLLTAITIINIAFAQDLPNPQVKMAWSTYFALNCTNRFSYIKNDTNGDVCFSCWSAIFDKPNVYSRFFWGKFDPDGKLLWKVDQYQNGIEMSQDLCVDSSNNIISGGKNTLVKLSPDGKIIWRYEPGEYIQFDEKKYIPQAYHGVTVDKEGSIFLFVQWYTGPYYFVKMDSAGEILWYKKLRSGYYNGYIQDRNSNIILIENWDRNGYINNIRKLNNKDGAVIAKYTIDYEDTTSSYSIRGFTIDSENNLIILGGTFGGSPYMAKCDSLGKIIWFNKVDHGILNGGVIPSGFGRKGNMGIVTDIYDNIHVGAKKSGNGIIDTDILLIKYNRDGKLIFKYEYGGIEQDSPHSISYFPPNIIYLAGDARSDTGIAYGDAYQDTLRKFVDDEGTIYHLNGFLTRFNVYAIAAEIVDSKMTKFIDTLDFGKVCIYEKPDSIAAIKNYSDFGITLKPPILLDTINFSCEYLRNDSLRFRDTIGLRIFFHPVDTGYHETKLYIYCQEQSGVLDSLLIRAKAVRTELTADSVCDFEYVKVGKSITKDIVFKNTGNADAFIKSINWLPAYWRFEKISPQPPCTIPPGENILVTVTFKPYNYGMFENDLIIESLQTSNSCTAAGKIKLKGIGITYELKPDTLDYGIIASCKTPIDTAKIINYAGTQVILTEPAVLINTNDFEIIEQPSAGFVLNYLDTAKYIVKFTPQAPQGIKNGEIIVKTNHPEEPETRIILTGTTEDINVTAEDINFGEVGIKLDHNNTSKVKNHNSFAVHIKEIQENEPWLSISPNDTLLQSGEEIELNISIKLDEAKPYTTEARIIIDEPCPDTVIFKINAIGIKSSVEVTPILDYKETEFCDEKVLEIMIHNTGKLPVVLLSQRIEGNDKDLFSFADNWNDIIILPDSSITEPVFFKPENSTNGIKTAEAINVILMDTEKCEFMTELTGERYEIRYEIPQDIDLSTRIKESAEREIEIKNTSKYRFTIEEIKLKTGAEFSFYPDLTGTSVNSGENAKFNLVLYSEKPDNYTDELYIKLKSDYCEYLDTISISGRVYMDMRVWLPDTVGRVGDNNFKIPLRVSSFSDTTLTKLSYTAEIRFDARFYIVDRITKGNLLESPIIAGEQKLTIEDNNIVISKGEMQLTELCGMILLGDRSMTPLKINSFEWNNPLLENENRDGSLQITGVCQPAISLVRSYTSTSMQIIPNPASVEVEIKILTEEVGRFVVSVYTMQGLKVESRVWEKKNDINHELIIKLNLEEYSSGLYQVIIQTPINIISLPLIILK